MRLFISHIHEESRIAEAIRDQLLACFGAQVEVFLAEDIPLGTNWFDEIKAALGRSDVLVVLFSRDSSDRPWVNIEAGYGVMTGKKVIPVCHSGFSRGELPIIYGLLQAVDLLARADVERLLDQIARATSAGQFLGNKADAVARWIDKVSAAVRATPRFAPRPGEPPCVWVLGSNRRLKERQAILNKRFVGYLAQSFIQRRIRVIFGRSGLLDSLGITMNEEADREQIYGLDRATLSDFGDASAMHKNAGRPAPNPVVLLGSFRTRRGLAEVFADSVGRVPDIAVVIGGSASGRTREEIQGAHEASIPVLPLRFSGGVAAELESTVDPSLSASVARIQVAKRDYSSVAQIVCDVIEQQAAIGRMSNKAMQRDTASPRR